MADPCIPQYDPSLHLSTPETYEISSKEIRATDIWLNNENQKLKVSIYLDKLGREGSCYTNV